MFYRYEVKHPDKTGDKWVGIFQAFNGYERRQWACLTNPVWYNTHPNVNSKAWFTEHGYMKWKNKMDEMIKNFHFGNCENWEFRIITSESLENIVVSGKTQIIQTI